MKPHKLPDRILGGLDFDSDGQITKFLFAYPYQHTSFQIGDTVEWYFRGVKETFTVQTIAFVGKLIICTCENGIKRDVMECYRL